MFADLNPKWLNVVWVAQRITYEAFERRSYIPLTPTSQDCKEMRVLLESSNLTQQFSSLVRSFQILFDETLWLPTDPDLYGNIMEVQIQPSGYVELFVFRVDFRRPITESVTSYQFGRFVELKLFNPDFKVTDSSYLDVLGGVDFWKKKKKHDEKT